MLEKTITVFLNLTFNCCSVLNPMPDVPRGSRVNYSVPKVIMVMLGVWLERGPTEMKSKQKKRRWKVFLFFLKNFFYTWIRQTNRGKKFLLRFLGDAASQAQVEFFCAYTLLEAPWPIRVETTSLSSGDGSERKLLQVYRLPMHKSSSVSLHGTTCCAVWFCSSSLRKLAMHQQSIGLIPADNISSP